jgi:hypothetical protein
MRVIHGFLKPGEARRSSLVYISDRLIQRAKKMGMWKYGNYSDLVNVALDEYLAKHERSRGDIRP